jgi:hypothetical protein
MLRTRVSLKAENRKLQTVHRTLKTDRVAFALGGRAVISSNTLALASLA